MDFFEIIEFFINILEFYDKNVLKWRSLKGFYREINLLRKANHFNFIEIRKLDEMFL